MKQLLIIVLLLTASAFAQFEKNPMVRMYTQPFDPDGVTLKGGIKISGGVTVGVFAVSALCGSGDSGAALANQTGCGPQAGSFSTAGMSALSACDSGLAAGDYYLTQNVAVSATATCFPVKASLRINGNGKTITGRVGGGSPVDVSGFELYNATVNASRADSGNGADVGSVLVLGDNCPTSAVSVHDVTVTNADTTGGRGIVVDISGTACASNKVSLYQNTSTAPTCTACARTSAIFISGAYYTLVYSNDVYCQAASNACQGIGFFDSAHSREHNNRKTMATVADVENGRAGLADTGSTGLESDHNLVILNNNRGFRIREAADVKHHDNRYTNMTVANGFAAQGLHLGDGDSAVANLGTGESYSNYYELNSAGDFFIAQARDMYNFTIHDEVVVCTSCGGDSWFMLARTPQFGGSQTTISLSNNNTGTMPGIDLSPRVMNWAQATTTINHHSSGTCGGAGTCTPY